MPDALPELASRFGTPLYVQDLDPIQGRVDELHAFDVVRYAVKANPSLAVLRAMRAAGAVVDCVSEGEVRRALAAGFEPAEITFTSDLFERRTLDLVASSGVNVNIGSSDMIEQYAQAVARREITLRVNPGFGHGHNQRVNTGGASSKHGIWHEELPVAVRRARASGLEITGLHVHIGSGSDLAHLRKVADAVMRHVDQIGTSIETVSAGGGLPVAYREEDTPLDVSALSAVWADARTRISEAVGHPIQLEVEPGRFLVAREGVLLAEVRAVKRVGELPWVLVDAGFHTLARPMLYGAYHRISVLGKESEPGRPTVVAGPLCESADVFTQTSDGEVETRLLPECRTGDLLCFHGTGAYGSSMASQYNSMPIAAEVVIERGQPRLSRPRTDLAAQFSSELELLPTK